MEAGLSNEAELSCASTPISSLSASLYSLLRACESNLAQVVRAWEMGGW